MIPPRAATAVSRRLAPSALHEIGDVRRLREWIISRYGRQTSAATRQRVRAGGSREPTAAI